MEVEAGNWKLGDVVSAGRRNRPASGRWSPTSFGCATDDRRDRRCNERSADCQSATQQATGLRYRRLGGIARARQRAPTQSRKTAGTPRAQR